MLSPGAQRLAAEQARDRPPQGVAYSWPEPATVTAIDGAGVVTVSYRGTTQQAARLSSYSPTVGDVVVLLVTHPSGTPLILGTPTGAPPD